MRLISVLLCSVILSPIWAQTVVQLSAVVDGLEQPVAIAHAGDQRLFIVERRGLIRIVDLGNQILPEAFLDIETQVDSSRGELGLLGLAFHPNYAQNGYFFIYYTYAPPQSNAPRMRLARLQVDPTNPNRANPGSEQIVLEFNSPFSNHNGGDLHFGPDGYLMIASGDGGGSGDPLDNAQNPNVLLGKLLRIDIDIGSTRNTAGPDCDLSGNTHYRIPPGNLYIDGLGGAGCDEIYATGLRNPWRISFDRLTGDLWIADVGQNRFEEINFIAANTTDNLNFGWRCIEGNAVFDNSNCTDSARFTPPLYAYEHGFGACSVTGGYVYRGERYPALFGQYFFADYCSGALSRLIRSDSGVTVSEVLPFGSVSGPTAFGEDNQGELYVVSFNDGQLFKLQGSTDGGASLAGGLGNISYNGPVDAHAVRPGFIVAETGTYALTAEGFASASQLPLADPLLVLRRLDGSELARNDNCGVTDIIRHIGRDLGSVSAACLVIILEPGHYFAEVLDSTNASGNVLFSITRSITE